MPGFAIARHNRTGFHILYQSAPRPSDDPQAFRPISGHKKEGAVTGPFISFTLPRLQSVKRDSSVLVVKQDLDRRIMVLKHDHIFPAMVCSLNADGRVSVYDGRTHM